jgi:hypothetical protein
LRHHAGWSGRSQMHLKYLHYFGNESSESLLEAYGIIPKGEQKDQLRPSNILTVMNLTNQIQSSVLNAEWY